MNEDKDKNSSQEKGLNKNGNNGAGNSKDYDRDFLDELAADQSAPDSKDIKGFSRVGKPKDASKKIHFDRYKISGDNVLDARPGQKQKPIVTPKPLDRLGNSASMKKEKRKKLFIAGIIGGVVLVGALIAAMLFMNGKNRGDFSKQDVTFTVDGPQEIKSGEEITYKIKGENNNKSTLTNVELVVTYPEKFTFISSAPVASSSLNNRWPVNDLKTKDSFEIEIKGRVVGEQETVASLNATLNYRPLNFNSDFSEEASLNTTLLSPAVSIDVEYSKQAIPGEEVVYSIRYTNTSQEIVTDAVIQIAMPDNFTLKKALPVATDSEKSLWELGKLGARDAGVIKLTGTLNGNVGETKRVTINLGTLDDDGNLIVETEELALTKLVDSSVTLEQTINKEKTVAVKPGGQLAFEIAYKNAGSTGLKGVSIVEALNTESIDLATVKVIGGSLSGNAIIWNNSGVPELEILDAGESGKVQFSAALKKTLTLTSASQKGLKVSGTATLESTSLKDKIESNTVIANIETVIALASEARYYDFEAPTPVGSGPLPPKVGSTTTYRVYLNVINTTTDVQDGIVTIRLAPGVSWADGGSVSVGENLQFNSSTSRVTWKIGNIPAGSGSLTADLSASFLVSITPASNQVGKIVDLTADGGTLEAADSLTGTKLTSTDQKLTTRLEFDDNAAGKEKVTN